MSDEYHPQLSEKIADILGIFMMIKVHGIDSIQEKLVKCIFLFIYPHPNMLTMETHSQTDLIQGKRGIIPAC